MKKLLLLLPLLAGGLHAAESMVSVEFADTYSLDGFGKIRTTQPDTLWDSKNLYNEDHNLYWTQSNTGTGAQQVYDTHYRTLTLTAGTVADGYSCDSTKTYWGYQPGKSMLYVITGNFDSGVAGVVKRIGAFDSNNGAFFMLSGTTLSVVLRSNTSGSVVDTIVPQSSWLQDTVNGTGINGNNPSNFNLNVNKSQIFIIDYQWLGVGRVRFGVQSNNGSGQSKPIYVHEIANNNVNLSTYMAIPNLPVRYEITNNGAIPAAAANLTEICSSVISEGGAAMANSTYAVATTYTTSVASGGTVPLLTLRVNSAYTAGASIRPISFWCIPTTSSGTLAAVYGICYNCAASGVGTYVSITNTVAQYAPGGTGITLTGTASVILGSSGIVSTSTYIAPLSERNIWASFDISQTVPDTITLYVNNIGGSANSYIGGMTFEQQE